MPFFLTAIGGVEDVTRMTHHPYQLSIVVPVYNESDMIEAFHRKVTDVMTAMSLSYQIVFVDDGSSDDTVAKIEALARQDAHVSGVKFSRNFGKDMALLAGLSQATGEYMLMIDGDLQHPPDLIPELWQHAQTADIVYTVRTEDRGVGLFKKYSSKIFYRLFSYLADATLEQGTTDFKIISRKVRDTITAMDERDLFLRGMFSWIGFTSTRVEFMPIERPQGSSKYNLRRLLNLSISGITSFSTVPIRLSLLLCAFSLCVAFLYSVYALYSKYILLQAVSGWTSLLILLSLFCSGIYVMLGIIGEYIAKIHIETKKRPRFIIDRVITHE